MSESRGVCQLRITEPRAMTHWRTRRKHRVSSEWINNRTALLRSKYCLGTLPLPFDPLRLIFLSYHEPFVLIQFHLVAHITPVKHSSEYLLKLEIHITTF